MGLVPGNADGLTPRQLRSHRLALRLLVPLAVTLCVLVIVFFGIYRPVVVSGPSMLPSLLDGDRLLVTRGAYTPRAGDVVVLHADESGTATELVKRVVATAGQVVTVRDSVAMVDGRVESGYDVVHSIDDRSFGPYEVPRGTVFVLGDNRPVSNDSRFIGPIPVTAIEGRAVAVYMPVTRMRTIPQSEPVPAR